MFFYALSSLHELLCITITMSYDGCITLARVLLCEKCVSSCCSCFTFFDMQAPDVLLLTLELHVAALTLHSLLCKLFLIVDYVVVCYYAPHSLLLFISMENLQSSCFECSISHVQFLCVAYPTTTLSSFFKTPLCLASIYLTPKSLP